MKIQKTKKGQHFITLPKALVKAKKWESYSSIGEKKKGKKGLLRV